MQSQAQTRVPHQTQQQHQQQRARPHVDRRSAASASAPNPAAATTTPGPPPPRTYGAVIREARSALRRFREARAEGVAPKRSADEPWRLQLDVPLPVASDIAERGVSMQMQDAPFTLPDEGDWPGGQLQRFRALRTVVEPLLEGYDASFIGMLGESLWRLERRGALISCFVGLIADLGVMPQQC